MKGIYIDNYLLTSRDEKLEFIKYIHSFKRFKINNQKIILNDNSLILELSDDSSTNIAKKLINLFFRKKKEVKVDVIDKIELESEEIKLFKDEKLLKKIGI